MPFGHTLLWPCTFCIVTHTGLNGKIFSKEFIIHLTISISFISFGEGIWNRQNWRASKLTKTCPDNRWKVQPVAYRLSTQNPTTTGCIPGIKEARPEDHYCLTSALLQLGLDRAELAVNDGHHALNLPRGHGPCTRLLPQQVHDMGGELSACLGRGGITQRTVKDRKQSSADSLIISCWFDVHHQQSSDR